MTQTTPPIHPHKTTTVGVYLFLAALGMLFGASLVAYLFLRPGRPSVDLPWAFWISTPVLLFASLSLHLAVRAIRVEKQGPLRFWLMWSLLAGILFVCIQTPSMAALLRESYHEQDRIHASEMYTANPNFATKPKVKLYAVVFVLVLLHAVHVIGGLIRLVQVTIRGYAGKYDHEHYASVWHTAIYWHFLDAVWLIMFGTLLVTH